MRSTSHWIRLDEAGFLQARCVVNLLPEDGLRRSRSKRTSRPKAWGPRAILLTLLLSLFALVVPSALLSPELMAPTKEGRVTEREDVSSGQADTGLAPGGSPASQPSQGYGGAGGSGIDRGLQGAAASQVAGSRLQVDKRLDAELYGVFEISAANSKSYSNPFDFRVVELRGTFTAPSGRQVQFFGFYDGDGGGGQTGDVWKLRFMPDEVGTWTCSYGWTDGTAGGSGSFRVVDTGIPGPARLDPRNPRLLVDSRGNPIHWRGYGIKHRVYRRPLTQAGADGFVDEIIDAHVVRGGYNAVYYSMPRLEVRDGGGQALQGIESIHGDYRQYNLPAMHFADRLMLALHDRRIWTIEWIALGYQTEWEKLWQNYQPLIRYFTARYGAFYNYFMWSPSWEVWELADWEHRTDVMMSYAASIDPWKRLQGVHDRAKASWQGWQSIQARQHPANDLYKGNNRTTGVDESISPYDRVIIGSEDIWEDCRGKYEHPRNGTEVRRALWGELMANVLPIYDENVDDMAPCGGLGNGEGEPFVKIAYDWWYGTVRYRNPDFQQLNGLVLGAAGQIASGIPGEEYVVYAQDGGRVRIDLSDVPSSREFAVLWFDPKTAAEQSGGTVSGGASLALASPFAGDSVLLLRATGAPQREARFEYKLGFKLLADQIPNVVGEPLENERWGANGDSLQQTSGGLLVWRKADNWTAFTNGWRTWVNGPFGIQERGNEERFDWERLSSRHPTLQ